MQLSLSATLLQLNKKNKEITTILDSPRWTRLTFVKNMIVWLCTDCSTIFSRQTA